MCEEGKGALRSKYRKIREMLSVPQRDEAVTREFLASPFAAAERFFVYLSVGSETPTRELIGELLRRGKKVCVPRIVGGEMYAVPLTDKLARGAYGIPSPEEGEDTPCDVAVAPLVAFDKTGNRLGRGGGFYDRYFAAHPNLLRVGFAYAGQGTDSLPHDEHDVRLHAVVTETGTCLFSHPPSA